MCDMRERGVATDRGKGPEFGNEVGSTVSKMVLFWVKLSV